ncbi:MAG: HPr kinase/phosphatase C-terminal domain-containing protein [Alphaproteobacteria bacterium]|nr:HPr kinase/phosphatase C-terminal domain-containing protein [Alphaproteobacteria bacterium]
MLLHASCVAIGGKGVLLAGPSGAGKSDLAVRLIDEGGVLVSDDQTALSVNNGVLCAAPPPAIAGMIEIRHIGLARLSFSASAPVALYVELTALDASIDRLPVPDETVFLLDHPVRRLRLPAFAPSTPAKIRAVLTYPLESDD